MTEPKAPVETKDPPMPEAIPSVVRQVSFAPAESLATTFDSPTNASRFGDVKEETEEDPFYNDTFGIG